MTSRPQATRSAWPAHRRGNEAHLVHIYTASRHVQQLEARTSNHGLWSKFAGTQCMGSRRLTRLHSVHAALALEAARRDQRAAPHLEVLTVVDPWHQLHCARLAKASAAALQLQHNCGSGSIKAELRNTHQAHLAEGVERVLGAFNLTNPPCRNQQLIVLCPHCTLWNGSSESWVHCIPVDPGSAPCKRGSHGIYNSPTLQKGSSESWVLSFN